MKFSSLQIHRGRPNKAKSPRALQGRSRKEEGLCTRQLQGRSRKEDFCTRQLQGRSRQEGLCTRQLQGQGRSRKEEGLYATATRPIPKRRRPLRDSYKADPEKRKASTRQLQGRSRKEEGLYTTATRPIPKEEGLCTRQLQGRS